MPLPHVPPAYTPAVLDAVIELHAAVKDLDALNVELYRGAHIARDVVAYAVYALPSGFTGAVLVADRIAGQPPVVESIESERMTVAQWLKNLGVPVVRLGTRQPTGSSSIRFNPDYKEPDHE